MLLRPRADSYRTSHPTGADVLLIVEVADTSLEYDRDRKLPLYARSGVPESWLLDIANGRLVVYQDPSNEGYRLVRIPRPGDTLRLAALPDVEVRVDDLLG